MTERFGVGFGHTPEEYAELTAWQIERARARGRSSDGLMSVQEFTISAVRVVEAERRKLQRFWTLHGTQFREWWTAQLGGNDMPLMMECMSSVGGFLIDNYQMLNNQQLYKQVVQDFRDLVR